MKNITDLNINEIKENKEYPPYKCKMCGEGIIENQQEICNICGWQDCEILFQNPDCFGGPSVLSYNQYKKVWDNNKNIIRRTDFGKYSLIKRLFEENPDMYGYYCDEQIKLINKYKK